MQVRDERAVAKELFCVNCETDKISMTGKESAAFSGVKNSIVTSLHVPRNRPPIWPQSSIQKR